MSPNTDNRRGPDSRFAACALLLVPALCCAVPLLIATGALATLAAILTNPWVIGIVGVALAVAAWRIAARRMRPSSDARAPKPHPGNDAAITPDPTDAALDPHPGGRPYRRRRQLGPDRRKV
jgi:hypothetical protein